MAHVEKFAISAIGHMCDHYERGRDVKRSNENIDSSRTPQNYNLGPARELSQVDFIRQRTGEVKCQKRADVKVMCDWVITIPKDFQAPHPQREREFFQQTYDFLAKRYGEANVVSAYVHKDEVTPHMHFAFVPVTEDKRRGGLKVSAKEVLTRTDLRTFHGELQAHLEKTLGVEVNVLNEATKDGNQSIAELKRKSAKERLDEINAKTDRINERINGYKERINALSAAYSARKEFLDSPAIKTMVEPIKRTKSGFMGLGGDEIVTLRASDFDRLQKQAAEAKKCREYCDTADKHYRDWWVKSAAVVDESVKKDAKIKKMEKQLESSKEKNSALKADVAELTERNAIAAAVMEQLPAAKALYAEIKDRRDTEKILAYEPKEGFANEDKNTFYAEMQRQILFEGRTAATLDYSKAAALFYADNGNTLTTADLIKKYAKVDGKTAHKIAVKGRQLCDGRGMGMER